MVNILKISRHNELEFKSFEYFAKKKDIIHGLGLPRIFQEIFDKKTEILRKYQNMNNNAYEDIVCVYEKILNELPVIENENQDFNTVYTDDSFNRETMNGGASAIIVAPRWKLTPLEA